MTGGKSPKRSGEDTDAVSMGRDAAPTARSRLSCSVLPGRAATAAAAPKVAWLCGDAGPPLVVISVLAIQLPQHPIVRMSVDTNALFDSSHRTA